MEFLHPMWSGNLANPFPMDVESAPRTQKASAADLDASHRVFPPLRLKLCHRRTHRRQDPSSVPRSGHVPRASEAWADATFSCRLMARCVVGKGPRSIRRNDAPNTMERCACSMPPASLTVAPVPCVSPVKNTAPPPKNLAVSALSCIPCLSLRQKSRRLRALLLLPLQLIPSCGGIGHARSLAEPGSVGSAATWSPCKLHSIHHLPSRLLFSRAPSERIGV